MDLTRLFWFLCYPNLRLVLKWNVNSKLHFCFISSFICYCYKILKKTHDNWMDLNLIFRQTGSAWKGFRCYLGKVHFKKENLIADQSNLYISSFFQIMTQLVRSSSLTFKKNFNDKNRNQIRLFVYLMFHKRIHSQMFIP